MPPHCSTRARRRALGFALLALLGIALARAAGGEAAPGAVSEQAEPAQPAALVFDATTKECVIPPGASEGELVFHVRNASTREVVIAAVNPSCGCTVAEFPASPWRLPPGGSGEIRFHIDVQGKSGELYKTATVVTSEGPCTLRLKIVIAAPPGGTERARNVALATADRQTVFRGDCARCHAAPTAGLTGVELFAAACGICHQAEHRALFVPEIWTAERPTTAEYWREIVTSGKPGTLMPAFAAAEGGPLDEAQIVTLVEYLRWMQRTRTPPP